MGHRRSLCCHLLPTQTQHVLAPRSSFLWTLVLYALPAEFTLLFPEALSPLSICPPFLFLLQDSQLLMLGVKCGIIPSSWYIRGPGGWPSISALLWVSSPNFKAACFLKGAGLCRNGFCTSKGECISGVNVLTCPQFSPAHRYMAFVFGSSQLSKKADGFVCYEPLEQ